MEGNRKKMYTFVVYMSPVADKRQDLLNVLAERNTISNANGYPHMVAQRMFGSEPMLAVITQFTDLAAYEGWLTRNQEDQAFQQAGERIRTALVRPGEQVLMELLERTEATGTPGYFLAATSFAAPGKARQLREALQKAFSSTPSAGTVSRALRREIAPEDGANFTTSFSFASLADLDAFMHDPALGRPNAEVGDLLLRPNRQRLYRVLMPAASS